MLIPLDLLIKKYNIPLTGVLHVGAHHAEEADVYKLCGFKKVTWIEGNAELIPLLQKKLRRYPSQKVYQAVIDVEEKDAVFNVTSDPQSSSLFKLKEHATQYPSVTLEKQVICKTQRLDSFLRANGVNSGEFNFLNLDIQGNELNALKSLGDDLIHFDFIYTEVQLTELYAESHNLYEIDQFLFSKNFRRAETSLQYRSWGDALYIRVSSAPKFQNFFNLAQSRFLVWSWPFRKKIYWINDQAKYVLKNKLLKKSDL